MKDELTNELERLKREKKRLASRNKLQDLAGVCNRIGEVLFQLGRYEEAKDEHLAEEAASVELGDTLGLAIASRKIGECYSELGKFSLALEYQRKHLELAQAIPSPVEEQRAWATIGRTHLEEAEVTVGANSRSSLDLAEEAFHKSLNICSKLRPPEVGRVEAARMRGRLYLNLGVVMDCRGNAEGCREFIDRAMKVHRENNCYEDLQYSHYSMALIHKKHGRYDAGLQEAEEALNVSQRLGSNERQVEVLSLMGDLCLFSGKFEQARQSLKRAYRLSRAQCGGGQVRRTLKVAVKLCRTLNALEGGGSNDFAEKLALCEKMGDLLCDVGCFGRAIDSYLRALDCSRRLGQGAEGLAPLYVSLAETYVDAKEYGSALEYYGLELECWDGNPYEQCRTILNMADCEERLGSDRQVVLELYERALKLSLKACSLRLERRCLQSLLAVQGEENSQRTKLEERLRGLPSDDDESDADDGNDGVQSDSSVALSESEDDTSEDHKTVCRVRRSGRRDVYRIARNTKGETPLHLACIAGNLKLVKKLIEEGHPVNERDNCGWLPLHEAANHDFCDIVRVLLENGAHVNDRGGETCEGVTPLHDAATNGHTDMVRLLVESGASLLARTDAGDTAVHCLRSWRRRVKDEVAPALMVECRQLETELERRMEELGVSCVNQQAPESESPLFQDDLGVPATLRHQKMGRSTTADSHRDHNPDHIRMPALLSESKLVPASEEWLLNDLAPRIRPDECHRSPLRKRRRCSDAVKGSSSGRRRCVGATATHNPSSSGTSSAFRRQRTFDTLKSIGSPENCITEYSDDFLWPQEDSVATATNIPSSSAFRRHRTFDTLKSISRPENRVTDYGDDFSWPQENSATPVGCGGDRKRRRRRSSGMDGRLSGQSDTDASNEDSANTLRMANETPTSRLSTPLLPPTSAPCVSLRIKVKVLDKLLLIPVQPGERVSWLAREAAQRYYAMFGLRPVLALSTKEGALLCLDDAVENVLCAGEEVIGTLQSYELPPLPERYEKACAALTVVAHRDVRRRLETAEAEMAVILSDLRLTDASVRPIVKALQCQTTLKELNLSGNLFRTQGLEALASALQHLPGLRLLDLSNNDITDSNLRSFVQPISGCQSIPKLETLNLGFNPLLDEGCEQLSRLLVQFSSLTSLVLPSVITDDFGGPPAPHLADALARAKGLRHLDLSFSRLPAVQIQQALDVLQSDTLVALNLSGISVEFMCEAICRFLERDSCVLRELVLKYCSLNQQSLDVLLPGLRSNRRLQILDITGNRNTRGTVLQSLLEDNLLRHLKIVSSHESDNHSTAHRTEDPESLEESIQWTTAGIDEFLLASSIT